MICLQKRIPYKYGDTIRIKPLADVHIGNRWCDTKKFKEYVADNDPNTYFVGVGDMIDAVIVKDEKRYKKSSDGSPQHEDAILDYQIKELETILEPVKSNIIALGIGNHEEAIVKHCSTNPVKTMCSNLGAMYGGYNYFLKLILHENGARVRPVTFFVHHGWSGGSRTAGGDITKFTNAFGNYDADVFLVGHVHKSQYYASPKIGTDGNKLVVKKRFIVICGSFLKTLSDSTDVTYAELAGYPPIHLSTPELRITPRSSGVKIEVGS